MLRKLVLFALLGLACAAAPAVAQVQTSVNMDMPGFVILYYRSSVTFNIDQTELSSALAPTANGGAAPPVTTLLGGDVGVTGAAINDPSTLLGRVTSFWAVRSVGSALGTQVNVSVTGSTLAHSSGLAGVEIDIANAGTRVNGSGAPFGASVTFPSTGLGTVVVGDVEFDVDLSGVSRSGSYAGGEIEIEALNL